MNIKKHPDQRKESREDRLGLLDRTMRAANAQRILYSALLANKMGLRQVDLECLFIITLNDNVTPGRLSKETGLTTGAITAMIDRMQASGFIKRTRDPQDRRRIFLVPEAKRIAQIRAANKHMHQLWTSALSQYSDDELNILLDFADRNYRSAIAGTAALQKKKCDRGNASIIPLPDRNLDGFGVA